MKKLQLLKLSLNNFMGCKEFEFSPNGKNADVFGQNATGKTTLYTALCFLLFGKDSSFKTDFEIKTLHADGTCEHCLDHEVKGLFKWDGKVIELKKVYSEIYTKKRGSSSKEMTGHTTDFWIDSVPKSKKEFTEYVSGIATEETFKLLTSPFYFSEIMKPADRREFLMSLGSNVTDEQVIASDKELAPLKTILATRSIDDHKKVITAARKELNSQLEKIPIRIDEVAKGTPDISGIILLEEEDNIKDGEKELESIAASISNLKNTGALAELERDLVISDTAVLKAAQAITKRHNEDVQKVRTEINALGKQIDEKVSTAENLQADLTRQEETRKFILDARQRLVDEYKKLKADDLLFQQYVNTGECTCALCGDIHAIPADKIAIQIGTHNEELSLNLERNKREGMAKKSAIEDADNTIKTINKHISSLEKEIPPLRVKKDQLEESINDPEHAVLNMMMESDPALSEATTKKKLIMDRIEREKSGAPDTTKIAALESSKTALNNKVADARVKIAQVKSAEDSLRRLVELDQERRTAAAEFERLEGELYLMDQFTRAKVAMLEGEINGMFKMAKFRLFEEQINGGLAPCCKVTYKGVPFESSLNNSSKINTGIDICNTISRVQGISLPLIVDNAESVVELIPTESQVIRLVVSKPDDVLRVEIAE
jgi:hypothetical protein